MDEWHHYKVEFECGTGSHYGLDQYEYKVYLDNSSYGVFEMNGTPSTLNELKFSTWTTNDTIFYADAVGFSWDGNYTIGDNYEDNNITSWNSYFTTKLNGSIPELMNLHSDVLRLIPWLANYKNSEQGRKPQGFSEWMKQKLEEFRDFVVGMFAWLAAALEDLKEMLEELLEAIMLNLLEWLLYLIWLMIRAALLVLAYIILAVLVAILVPIFLAIYGFLCLVSYLFDATTSYEISQIKFCLNNSVMKLGFNILWIYNNFFQIEFPNLELFISNGKSSLDLLFGVVVNLMSINYEYESLSQSSNEKVPNLSGNNPFGGPIIEDTFNFFYAFLRIFSGFLPLTLFCIAGAQFEKNYDGLFRRVSKSN